jgi:SAM-dependent methyltransferase
MAEQTHQSDPRILGRRTLESNHRRLAAMLRPDMSVLDVGCGTGAITAGIAKAVGAGGAAVGIDKDASLIAIAREQNAGVPNLRFDVADVLTAPLDDAFDIVTAARALQWMHDPAVALSRMVGVLRPGGYAVVLDYNHADSNWEPAPPLAFRRFYDSFLRWRETNGWVNQMGDSLPALLRQAGLTAIEISVEDEISDRDAPGWRENAAVMLHVVETIGRTIVSEGFVAEQDRLEAEHSFQHWIDASMRRQTLSLRAAAGQR